MGFLDWLNRKLEYKSKAVLHIDGTNSFSQEVVGESHYQRHLKMLSKVQKQEPKSPLIAELHCENENEFDNKAVRIDIKGLCVGYLPKADARRYRKKLLKHDLGTIVVSCEARIFGGSVSQTLFGVWLDLPIDDL